MNIKSDYEEASKQMRKIFAEEIADAEAQGYLVMCRGLEFDDIRGTWIADMELVKDRISSPMRLRKRIR